MMAGQVAGLVNERKTAADVVREMMAEACALGGLSLAGLAQANAQRARMTAE